MNKEDEETYQKEYARFGAPNTGELPTLQDYPPDIVNHFFWEHVKMVRHHGKKMPLKPRRKLKPEEMADLRRDLEMIVHQGRFALAYLRDMK